MKKPADHDHLRSLDDVEPPDQWDDILVRSQATEVTPLRAIAGGGRSYRPLLVAAALIVIATLGGVFVMTTRTGDRGELQAVAADEPGQASSDAPDGVASGPIPTTPDGAPATTTTTAPRGGTDPGSGTDGAGTTPSGGGTGTGTGSGSHHGGSSSATTTVPPRPTTTLPRPTTTTAPPRTTTTAPPSGGTAAGAEAFFGHRWTVTAISQGGSARSWGSRTLVLDATTDGQISMQVCNRLSGPTVVDASELSVTLDASTGLTCGEPLDGIEDLLSSVLRFGPGYTISGTHLTLVAGDRRVELSTT